MPDPRFPIGKFNYEGTPSAGQREKFIAEIEHTPAAIRAAVQGLSPKQLETAYRDGGWNLRQVVHHVPESHMNAYIRFKLALTEDEPHDQALRGGPLGKAGGCAIDPGRSLARPA